MTDLATPQPKRRFTNQERARLKLIKTLPRKFLDSLFDTETRPWHADIDTLHFRALLEWDDEMKTSILSYWERRL